MRNDTSAANNTILSHPIPMPLPATQTERGKGMDGFARSMARNMTRRWVGDGLAAVITTNMSINAQKRHRIHHYDVIRCLYYWPSPASLAICVVYTIWSYPLLQSYSRYYPAWFSGFLVPLWFSPFSSGSRFLVPSSLSLAWGWGGFLLSDALFFGQKSALPDNWFYTIT